MPRCAVMEVTFPYYSNIKCNMALILSYTSGKLIFVTDTITPGRVKKRERERMADGGIIVSRYAYEAQ